MLDSALKQYRMIKKKGYFDSRLNPAGKGIENKYRKKVVEGDTVIYDAATKLMWQGGKGFPRKTWKDAKAYVDRLNTSSYAGFKDWRLPTSKKEMSLMEPERVGGLYIDAPCMNTSSIWTADEYAWTDKGDASTAWAVGFGFGNCDSYLVDYGNIFVRAVR